MCVYRGMLGENVLVSMEAQQHSCSVMGDPFPCRSDCVCSLHALQCSDTISFGSHKTQHVLCVQHVASYPSATLLILTYDIILLGGGGKSQGAPPLMHLSKYNVCGPSIQVGNTRLATTTFHFKVPLPGMATLSIR